MTGGAAVLFIFLLGAGGATMLVWLRGSSNSTATENSKAAAAKVEVVPIPGGTFKMGRSDIRLDSAELVNQYPAHPVTVAPFYMDKTEVTNAEYADFVRETKYAAPDSWADGAPPPGRERWPVTNVTKGDAEAFAAWRSKRDGVQYRLPTEEEWEFAARGGGMNLLYPWGAEWRDGLANVGGASPQPVGSFPQGASKDGVLDLIGNVWEWTSSKNSLYPGNDAATLVEGETVITRGGSYSSKPGAAGGITATRRRATPPNTKHQSLGFRLVRSAQ
jgi:serine/threonine-protein kinase